jgi:hypothetical protein
VKEFFLRNPQANLFSVFHHYNQFILQQVINPPSDDEISIETTSSSSSSSLIKHSIENILSNQMKRKTNNCM